jgi:hypothetical protein
MYLPGGLYAKFLEVLQTVASGYTGLLCWCNLDDREQCVYTKGVEELGNVTGNSVCTQRE